MHSLKNGLALTPPMGWNPYNVFWGALPEAKLLEMANIMVKNGMLDAGYTYIALDCGWSKGPDSNGVLQPKPDMYPHGLKYLADSIHALGLKFSMYADIGVKGCCGSEQTFPYYKANADQWAKWGVDYVKVDFCGSRDPVWWSDQTSIANYSKLRDAILQSGRPMVYSLCEWGATKPWQWADTVGNLWRTTLDISNSWKRVMELLPQNEDLYKYAGPGHWNDADMLEVGNLATNESRAHFSLWCILASPLMAGNDIRSMDDSTKMILLNSEVIAIDQDSLGAQGHRIDKDATNGNQIWLKPLRDGSKAVVFFNRAGDGKMSVKWSDIGVTGSAKVRDLWQHKDMGNIAEGYSVTVPGSDVVMIKVSGANVTPTSIVQKFAANPKLIGNVYVTVPLERTFSAPFKYSAKIYGRNGVIVQTISGIENSGKGPLLFSTQSLSAGQYSLVIDISGQKIYKSLWIVR